MSRPMIIIAASDENYLAALEDKFITELGDQIELEIISDGNYFEQFFSTPKTVEMLAVDEKFYSSDLQRHNIANLYILGEEDDSGSTKDLSVTYLYKYTGMKELYNELMYKSLNQIDADDRQKKATQVVALYSAIGGSGKTGLGIGLAGCLVQNHRRVLYINTESIQDFGYYLEDKTGMTTDGYRALRDDLVHPYNNVKHFVRREGFSYLPPFLAALDSLNLDESVYRNLIQTARDSRDYDFIIVDIEAGYSRERMKLLQDVDRVILVQLQDAVSVHKMEYIARNIDFGDREKYLFICNKYDETKENAYFQSELQKKFAMTEYVENTSYMLERAEQFAELKGIQKLAYMFI